MTTTDPDSSGRPGRPAGAEPPAAEDLVPGAVIAVPAGVAGRRRPFGLRITGKPVISQATGAVTLAGHALGADGTTTRRRPLPLVITADPRRLTVIRRAGQGAVPAFLDVQPSRTQVAAVYIPPGITIRFRHWDAGRGGWAVSEMHDADHPVIALMPGDSKKIGWLTRYARYDDPGSIAGRGRAAGRDIWQEAARRIQDGGLVYVQLEQDIGARRPAWTAVSVTGDPALPAGPAARAE